ncbi:MAG: FAD-dependent oxidoreductase [Planctomycetes bacterium]|nr:FAD-dependent oxidoreductase [Planctomycetota bacterium]
MASNRRRFLKVSVAAAALGGLRAAADEGPGRERSAGEVAFQRRVVVRHDVDVFVAGGGPSGVAAAVAAARQGARVFLVERNNCLGGMGTAGMLPLFMPFSDGIRNLAGGIGEEIQRRLTAAGGNGPFSDVTIRAEVLKRLYDDLLQEANVEFVLQTNMIAVESDTGRVSTVILAGKSGLFAVKAGMFLDCTGDGDLAAWAGAPFEKGDENGHMMAGTLCSLWADIDWAAVHEGGRASDESRLEDAIRDKVLSFEDRHLPGMFWVGEHTGGGNIGHTFGLDATDERSITQALLWARKSLTEYERYYKKYLKGFERMELVATASQLGCRESRRILGDYVLHLEDFKSRAVFPDEIGRYNYAVDIHAAKPDLASYQQYADDFRNLRYGPGESYGIPYRCLVPRTLTNVLVAGRCVSTDRYIQSSIRVMPGCFITGQAIGVAAALCTRKGCDTRSLPVPELQRRLKDLGAYLPNC